MFPFSPRVLPRSGCITTGSDELLKNLPYIDIAEMAPNKLDKLICDVIGRWPLEDLLFVAITGGDFGDSVLVDRIFSPFGDDSVSLHTTNMFRLPVPEV